MSRHQDSPCSTCKQDRLDSPVLITEGAIDGYTSRETSPARGRPMSAREKPLSARERSTAGSDAGQMASEPPEEGTKMPGGLSLQKPKLSRTCQKEVVIDAVQSMERENEQLRVATNRLLEDIERMHKENDKLRREVDSLRAKRETWVGRIQKLEAENRRLHQEVEIRVTKFRAESERKDTLNESLTKENEENCKLIETIQKSLSQSENDLTKRTQELERLKVKLDLAYRRNFDDHRMELLHEVELLKTQRRDFCLEREQLDREAQTMKDEFRQLEGRLNEQEAELKNENRRHALLTKEFNSLLDENNRLKLQLRRRTSLNIQICPSVRGSVEEKLSEFSEPATARQSKTVRKRSTGAEARQSVTIYARGRPPPETLPSLPGGRSRQH